MAYSIRLSIPIPAKDPRRGLARFLAAIYEIAVDPYGGDMQVGPLEERRLKRRPDESFPCVRVTLTFDGSVDPNPVTKALDEIYNRAESIAFPDAPPSDGQ
ncbi:MAG: hypothetical protein L6R30_06540 [Thermoanaerobaculia bacterium]|nr:hypothetical protein [Thermoanaerobaculia bacterium]